MACLSRLVGLEALKISQGSLGLSGLQALVGSLGALSALSSLNLNLDLGCNVRDDKAFGDVGAAVLTPALPLLASSLRRLCLPSSGFEVAALATVLPALTALQALDLAGVGDEGSLSALVPCLAQLAALTLLSLGGNHVNEASLAALVPCLARLTALQHLDLGGCFWGGSIRKSPLLPSLVNAVGKLASLTLLVLRNNDLCDTGVAALASSLLHLSALSYLDICGNSIDAAGFDALGPALRRLPALRHLDLGDNVPNDTASGVFSLANALHGLVPLRHLQLKRVSRDYAPDDAANALAAVLAGLTRLTRLELHGDDFNKFGWAASVTLAGSLRSLSRLQHLDCISCCPWGGDMAALCRSLCGLTRLQHLNLAHNQGSSDCSEVAAALGSTLPSLKALTLLDLSYNGLDEGVAAALAPGLNGLSRLCQLNLKHNWFQDEGVALLGVSLKVG